MLPKSILGISLLMLAFGVGVAASGVGLFMYYQYKVDNSDSLIKNFKGDLSRARRTIRNEAVNARGRIQDELEPLQKLAATGETLATLLNQVQPSVWQVRTLDEAGAVSVGSAFVVASDQEKTFLVTSHSVVRAATVQPGPEVFLRKGDEELKATVWTWDETNDLALLILNKGGVARLSWAPTTSARLGDRVFALSGLGTAGGVITQGFLADVSASGVQHDAPLGLHFRGGPLINSKGQVVAVASRDYAPLGFRTDGVYFAPAITRACDKVLSCPKDRPGVVSGAGERR